ncbi:MULTISPECIES: HEPN domain-containing protein [Pelosinus]|jgi:HEPN domain-containing protein|uniref:HEPN domain protein n=1 Tax=Pelosinus fermentans B4 TaxID=1149862 RepID=I9LEF4_9FIRM|nr:MULTISPECIES: HEPN domain-containing protein [Pelosinus]EIW18746.1 HEPN domain protein [Pelosinus fermentans B4]EIW22044.1 HEPN domain protein [Pelosinus fermentans A11]OAM95104.1 HEPN domain protein [Pelosinus fermentans DSM 17108]SDR23386.1 HEPN domain-containing protein [Pelosinus fermentans]
MNNETIAREWFRYAMQDLASANYLQGMQPIPVEIICYHCQQSVEKYLKGFISLKGGNIRKTHDLVDLNKGCSEYDSAFLVIEEDCLNLSDYGVHARYPFNLELNESDALLAITSAERVQTFLQEKLFSDQSISKK